ncbi:hypothetical protein HBH70_076370 [Parastagonospora nodorum]|nr:hypothetical protein HBH70_076370 [Parastagonospora nodorum]
MCRIILGKLNKVSKYTTTTNANTNSTLPNRYRTAGKGSGRVAGGGEVTGRYAYENSYTPNYEAYGWGYWGGRYSSGGGDNGGGGGCDSGGRGGGGGGD